MVDLRGILRAAPSVTLRIPGVPPFLPAAERRAAARNPCVRTWASTKGPKIPNAKGSLSAALLRWWTLGGSNP